MKCDKCGSTGFLKNGTKWYKTGRHQMYRCIGCGTIVKGELIERYTKGKNAGTEGVEVKETTNENVKPKNLMNLMKKL